MAKSSEKSESKFKVGDLVRLKSGGPKMTVGSPDMGRLRCQWFAGAKHENAVFHQDTLELAKDEKTDEKKSGE